MKPILIATGIALVIGGIYLFTPTDTVEYEQEVATSTVEAMPVDVIEQSRLELERINAELDTKETELLEERDAIDAELERLRQTRISFQ